MRSPRGYHRLGRRDLVVGTSVALASCTRPTPVAPGPSSRSIARPGAGAPEPMWGVQSGDLGASRAVIWSRSDRPSRMIVEWSTSPSFASSRRIIGPTTNADVDFTAKVALDGLPAATRIHYRVRFEAERSSDWIPGGLSTAPSAQSTSDVVFVWSGDTNGQGWGIDPARGGMPAFTSVLDRAPDFFVSCGDAIYADNPIPEQLPLPGGETWKNVVTAAKSHVAVTLDDFRGNHLYPRLSREVRALSASVPTFAIWDDHEVRNNWFPGESLPMSVDALAAHARRAMLEYMPALIDPSGPMYRSVQWGPLLELFLVDGRTFRTANYPAPPEEAFFGAVQLAWLEGALRRSTAVWKVIACNMPISLVVSEPAPDGSGADAFDGFANTNGPPSGRERELVHLFEAIANVKNVVWLTADVHYAAAHHYDPTRARHRLFNPFWEFVAGPMHATAFPRKRFDDTFGPELAYASAGWDTFGSPATGQQYFGVVRIDGRSRAMRVTLVDQRGHDLHTVVLRPAVA